MCVPNETNNANVKVYNMITRTNEVKTLVKHISYDCKCKFASRTFNSNQKWNTVLINANLSVKSIVRAKKVMVGNSWNPSTCVYEVFIKYS